MNRLLPRPRISGASRTIALALTAIASCYCTSLEAREPDGYLRWDTPQLAAALHLKPEDVREYFTDGRRISLLIERRVMREVLNGKLAPHEGTPYDVVDAQGGNWDIRSISDHGVYFSPSHMVGSGRRFEPAGFFAKLDVLSGYVLADIERFPDIPYWKIPTAQVRDWWRLGALGSDTKITRKKILELLERQSP